jgi:predicted amidophosphoribosyltransferase
VSVCLRRAAGSATQAGAGRSERLAAGRIAVAVRGRPPGRAVLVDDVHTTGATLHTCAAALRLSGTERVDAVTFARTIVHFP